MRVNIMELREVRWRSHLRAIAILSNGLFAFWLVMIGGSWYQIGYLGRAPFIFPPLVAIIALVVMRPDK